MDLKRSLIDVIRISTLKEYVIINTNYMYPYFLGCEIIGLCPAT